MSVDFAAWRKRFAVFHERTYLATQCLGPFPEEMLADLDEYRQSLLLRSRALEPWWERRVELIGMFEELLHAPEHSIALFGNATAGQAQLAAALTPSASRNRIVISSSDFHSTRYLWTAQSQRGFEVIEAADARRAMTALDERVQLIALSLVSPRTGALTDAAALVAAAHAVGALVVLDAYQAVGVVPIDVRALGVDAVVGGTHKWLCGGGTGLAFLYVRPELAETLSPRYPGWWGHREILGFGERYVPGRGAERFEQGTPAMEPVYTARAGLRFVLQTGVAAIRARNLQLTGRLMSRAVEAGLVPLTPRAADARGGMVCLDVPDAEVVVERLEAMGIDIDSRPGAGIRIAPHACNTEEECDRAIDAIVQGV
jgi:kynureninase